MPIDEAAGPQPEAALQDELSKSALAREIGVTPGRVSHYVARGLPVLPDGRVSRAAASAWIAANVDLGRARLLGAYPAGPDAPAAPAGPARGRARKARGGASLGEIASSRARREAAQAEEAELRLARMKGELCEVAGAREAAAMAGAALVELLNGRRNDLVASVRQAADDREAVRLMERADLAFRNALADRWEREIAEPVAGEGQP